MRLPKHGRTGPRRGFEPIATLSRQGGALGTIVVPTTMYGPGGKSMPGVSLSMKDDPADWLLVFSLVDAEILASELNRCIAEARGRES